MYVMSEKYTVSQERVMKMVLIHKNIQTINIHAHTFMCRKLCMKNFTIDVQCILYMYVWMYV
jgi:hypothetical protein